MQAQETWRRLLLRTPDTAKLYEEAQKKSGGLGCRLCHDQNYIKEFDYWLLMPNAFPYDRYFSKSDMLVTKRHTDGHDLTTEEQAEFKYLKAHSLTDDYDLIFENLPKQKSIPHHQHYHLVEIKKSV
jgi:hypothetical protein